MLKKKVPAIYLILSVVICFAVVFLAFKKADKNEIVYDTPASSTKHSERDNCGYDVLRLNGYKYIRPIMAAEKKCESIEKYGALKSEIQSYISYEKTTGLMGSISVYLEDYSGEDWMGIDADLMYMPGSLLKVPTLITYLKMAERTPGLLDKEFLFNSKLFPPPPKQTFDSKTIETGHKYKVRELLHNMMAYSDNYSTWLLNSKMDVPTYVKVYSEVGLPQPADPATYHLSAKQYSRLLTALYNVGYLSMQNSEYAMSLFSECDFKEGMVKKLPPSIKVAHKFGEAGTHEFIELHESGMVYLGDKPYLLTVMTKGKDVIKQAEVISNISKIAYDHMSTMKRE